MDIIVERAIDHCVLRPKSPRGRRFLDQQVLGRRESDDSAPFMHVRPVTADRIIDLARIAGLMVEQVVSEADPWIR